MIGTTRTGKSLIANGNRTSLKAFKTMLESYQKDFVDFANVVAR
jgi:hypothetical protein